MRSRQTCTPSSARINTRCEALAVLISTAMFAAAASAEDACHRTLAIMSDASIDPVTVDLIARSNVAPVVAHAVNVPLLGWPLLIGLAVLVEFPGFVLQRPDFRAASAGLGFMAAVGFII